MTIEPTGTRLACVAGLLSVLIGGGTCAYPQQAAPDAVLRAYDFERDSSGWITLDAWAELGLTAEPDEVFDGASSLRLTYPGPAAEMEGPRGLASSLAVLLQGGPPGLCSLRFAIRVSRPTVMAAIAREMDESDYVCSFFLNAGAWHTIWLDLSLFSLGDDSDDEDDQLDRDELAAISFLDAGMFLWLLGETIFQEPPPDAQERILLLDNVELRSDPGPVTLEAPPPGETREGPLLLDDFEADAILWIPLGGGDERTLGIDERFAAAGQRSLRAHYQMDRGTLFALLRPLPANILAGSSGVRMSLCAMDPAQVAVGVEERDGSRYNKLFELPGAGDWVTVEATWDEMERDQETPDENERLDPETIKSLAIADATAAFSGEAAGTTLWVDQIEVLFGPATD